MLKKKFLLVLPLMTVLLSGCRKPNTAKISEANLKSLGLAALMYSQDYDERFPDMSTPETIKATLVPYLEGDKYVDNPAPKNSAVEALALKTFINPSTGRPFQSNTALGWVYNKDIANPASTILFYEDAPYDDGTRGFVYANGYVDKVPESNWPVFFASHTTPVQNSTSPSGY